MQGAKVQDWVVMGKRQFLISCQINPILFGHSAYFLILSVLISEGEIKVFQEKKSTWLQELHETKKILRWSQTVILRWNL